MIFCVILHAMGHEKMGIEIVIWYPQSHYTWVARWGISSRARQIECVSVAYSKFISEF